MIITYIHRAAWVVLSSSLLVFATGCMKGPGFLQQGSTATPSSILSETTDGMTGTITGDNVTTMSASQGDMAGVDVSFAPGALAIGTSVDVQSADDIVSDGVAIDLGMGTSMGLDAASTAVAVSADSDELSQPFTIALPLPSEAGLHLADTYEKLIVIYKSPLPAGGYKMGVIARQLLKIEDGKVVVTTEFFGVFQAAFTSELVTAVPAPVVMQSEIATKAEVRAMPPVVWDVKASVGKDRKVTFSYAVTGMAAMERCLLFIDSDKIVPWDFAVPMTAASYVHTPVAEGAHNLSARVSCRSMDGREDLSDWQDASVPKADKVEPAVQQYLTIDAIGPVNAANYRSYTVGGTCSAVGKAVLVASFNASVPCEDNHRWGKAFDLIGKAEGNLTVSAEHAGITKSKTVVKDTVPPTLTGITGQTIGGGGGTLVSPVILSGHTYAWSKVSGPGAFLFSSATSSSTGISSATVGTYVVKLSVSDAAGNSASTNATITVDLTAPTGFSVTPDADISDGYINAAEAAPNDPLVAVTDGDATSHKFALESGVIADCSTVAAGSFSATSPLGGDPASDGDWTVCVRFDDGLGNFAFSTPVQFAYDTTAPAFTVAIEGGASYTSTDPATVNITATPDGTWSMNAELGASCTGGSYVGFTSTATVTLGSEGTNTVSVEVKDAAGNAACHSDTIVYDATAPVLVISEETSNKALGEISIKLDSFVEANPNAIQLRMASGSTPPASCSLGSDVSGSWAFTVGSVVTIKDLDPSATYSFLACAMDDAGLVGSLGLISLVPGQYRVFVTPETFNGDLAAAYTGHPLRFPDGLSGADYRCQMSAIGQSLPGHWRAILSDEYTDAASRITVVPGSSILRLDGTFLVTNASTTLNEFLVSRSVSVSPSSLKTWTGSDSFGSRTAAPVSCLNWSTDGAVGIPVYGAAADTNTTDFGQGLCNASTQCQCNNLFPLQCINQQYPGLASFSASIGGSTDKIALHVDFPAGAASIYSQVVVYALLGNSPPACGSGTTVKIFDATSGYNNGVYQVPMGGSGRFALRACVYVGANVVASHVSNARTFGYQAREIFTTAQLFTGSFPGGVAGAHDICQKRAERVLSEPLNNNMWKAVLSTSGQSAAALSVVNSYAYNSVNGNSVATSGTSFFSGGSIANGPKWTELGVQVSGGAWTGSDLNGGVSVNNCGDWSGAGNGTAGSVTTQSPAGGWLTGSAYACSAFKRLYCLRATP